MRWTDEQVEWLEANANKGAAWCAREMRREFGVRRTEKSVQNQASRLCISLRRYEVCGECGAKVEKLVRRTGLCRACNAKRLRDSAALNGARIAEEIAQTRIRVEEERRRYEREYARERKRNSRMADGIAANYGDFVDLGKPVGSGEEGLA